MSLSVRRAWIEIRTPHHMNTRPMVALRKESVDRNCEGVFLLRKITIVALRKESVDRNNKLYINRPTVTMSLSVRRAWIEISTYVTRLPRVQGRSP